MSETSVVNEQSGQEATTEPTPGSEEYNAKMAEKYKEANDPAKAGAQATDVAVPAMPENGSEKFYNKETGEYNWQAHATEAEFKAQQAGKKDEKPTEETTEEQAEEDAAISSVIEKAGLTQAALAEQIATTGSLSEENYAALEKAGVPRDIVEHYAQMYAQQAEGVRQTVYEAVGGEAQWDTLSTWASQNMSQARKDVVNAMFNSPETMQDGLKLLMDDYAKASRGGEGTLATGGHPGGAGSMTAFGSRAEQTAAIRDPRYAKDPAYRATVAQRMQATRQRGGYVHE